MNRVATQKHSRICGSSRHILLPGAAVDYCPALLPEVEAAKLMAALVAPGTLAWRCDEIMMFGRLVKQPRLTVWVADPGITYRYSGVCMAPEPWIPLLSDLRRNVETAAGCRFNSVLINQYRDGKDYMGWHRDDERELGAEPVIASLSLGAARFFDLRHRDYRNNRIPVQRFELRSGDLIVMRGATQQNWQHRVPKQTPVSGTRVNLSFRMTGSSAHRA